VVFSRNGAGTRLTADDRDSEAYAYELPPELIAQKPAAMRDASRLMVVGPQSEDDAVFSELPRYLRPGDLLVVNETRVIPARLVGQRRPTGGRAELLLLHPAQFERYRSDAVRWIALARPARRLREGARLAFAGGAEAVVRAELAGGTREVEFTLTEPFETFLERTGKLPLPPYIRADSAEAQRRYQSVFARVPGSVAAPTASLHFTPPLIARLQRAGVETARIALDVGLGTFRPMTAEHIDDHAMHSESYVIPPEAAAAIETARGEGRRVVAVGTTVVRALEGTIRERGQIVAGEGRTNLFITPGFRFRVVDAMITNFHLPKSTLLVLVSAFAGRDRILRAYAAAVQRRYRFFSFGDAMLLARHDGGE
jgi:S-adenosylmethionine:tRNA ribosyltransferase-isomerase